MRLYFVRKAQGSRCKAWTPGPGHRWLSKPFWGDKTHRAQGGMFCVVVLWILYVFIWDKAYDQAMINSTINEHVVLWSFYGIKPCETQTIYGMNMVCLCKMGGIWARENDG